jgi:NAD(P)-dependent dehydrogenase (short-subunit alcohol dehydrogenase family)
MGITYDFKGQVALITGAASDMGLATARAFARAGAAVTLADVSKAALQQAVDEITSAGGKATWCGLRCVRRSPSGGHGGALCCYRTL